MTHENNAGVLDPALVIYASPQISITQLEIGDIQIDTARISPDFKNVEFDTVIIPYDHARDVAETMLALLKPRSAR